MQLQRLTNPLLVSDCGCIRAADTSSGPRAGYQKGKRIRKEEGYRAAGRGSFRLEGPRARSHVGLEKVSPSPRPRPPVIDIEHLLMVTSIPVDSGIHQHN